MPSRRHRGLTLSVVTHGGRPERWRDAIGEHAQTTTSSRGQLNFGHFARCIDARLMISGGWRLLPATATQVSSRGHFSAYLARHAVMRQVLILPTISLVFFQDKVDAVRASTSGTPLYDLPSFKSTVIFRQLDCMLSPPTKCIS